MPGVFVTRGMTFGIPSLSITFRDDGSIEMPSVTLQVRFDVCPTWLQLAQHHLDGAIAAKANRNRVWAETNNDAKAKALEVEFETSMQAIVAAAIAWDAFYAIIRESVSIPETTQKKWRDGRTSRHSQVAEVVRRGFTLKPQQTSILRAHLKELYGARDLAVHPSGKVEAPQLHPELDVGVEWRFAYFRAANAEAAVAMSANILWELAVNTKSRNPKISNYQKTLSSRLKGVFPDGPPRLPVQPQRASDKS